ncbi:MAG: hypothetical protein GX892_04470 [Thermoanaerobacteraceae bacterium]|jgi:hypothetical protein|nr:hypothetical protein [Thermoanaerobacteraceae bacterium]
MIQIALPFSYVQVEVRERFYSQCVRDLTLAKCSFDYHYLDYQLVSLVAAMSSMNMIS